MRILIADDDFASRVILGAFLKRSGHEVIEAVDGAEAWQQMQEPNAPSLALLDWMMPAMEGLEVVRRVRAMQSDQPPYLIILTVKDAKADLAAGLDSGANDYLVKPFDPDELRARIEVGRRMIEMQKQLTARVEELRCALEHIKTLQGILPVCIYCKRILDSEGFWNQLEVYVIQHSNAEFSHGICPECAKKLKWPGA
jgi:DNA-binding response OmpR family regulator